MTLDKLDQPNAYLIYETAVGHVEKVRAEDEIAELFSKISILYDLKNIAYLAVNIPGMPINEPYLAVTYSSEWVKHYRKNRYVEIDPTIRKGFSEMLPFDWHQLPTSQSPRLEHFFGEASDFGVGRQGLTVPVRGQLGERAIFSIASDLPLRAWENVRGLYMRDFQVLATHFHQMMLRLHGIERDEAMLARREIECLFWTSEGKSAEECAMILGLSARTVRAYLENARRKLDVVTTTQAVAKALKLDLLSPQL